MRRFFDFSAVLELTLTPMFIIFSLFVQFPTGSASALSPLRALSSTSGPITPRNPRRLYQV